MINFSFCSKLLIALAITSAILNLLQPGYNTFYGLNKIKPIINLHVSTAAKTTSQYVANLTRLNQPAKIAQNKDKNCDKFAREYEAMLTTITQLEKACKSSNQ